MRDLIVRTIRGLPVAAVAFVVFFAGCAAVSSHSQSLSRWMSAERQRWGEAVRPLKRLRDGGALTDEAHAVEESLATHMPRSTDRVPR